MGSQLSFIRDGRPEGTIELEASCQHALGRDPKSGIHIKSHGASRRHCQLSGHNGVYHIMDLGSANGTLVNGVLINGPTQLSNGDYIQIGDVLLQFTEDEEEELGATIMMRPAAGGGGQQVVRQQPQAPITPIVPPGGFPNRAGAATAAAPPPNVAAGHVPVAPVAYQPQPGAGVTPGSGGFGQVPVVGVGGSAPPGSPGAAGGMPAMQAPAQPRGKSRDLQLGQVIRGFKIVREVDSNARGCVYKAKELSSGEPVAIKTINLTRNDPTAVKRFIRGARKAAELGHRNLCRVKGMGATELFAFMVLEWVEGQSAKQRMEEVGFRGMMEPRDVCLIAIQVASALELAASKGVVHRDIKPETILLRRDGIIKLAGMGLAKSFTDSFEDEGLSVAGQIVGTINYAAPETLIDPGAVDQRADIYSLGAAMWGMLCGHPPFNDLSYAKTFQRIQEEEIQPPRQINMSIPERLSDVVTKAMKKLREDRYPKMTDMLRDLMLAKGDFPKG